MTLSELRDAFIAEYKAALLGSKDREAEIPDKLIALWVSEAEQDISRRLRPAEKKTELTVTAGNDNCSLPDDFGHIVSVSVSGQPLRKSTLRELSEMPGSAGQPNRYALYYDSGYKLLLTPVPASQITIQLWYTISTGFYQPSESPSQTWGSFNGTTFSGDMAIADIYIKAVKYYLLSKVIGDYNLAYEREMLILKQTAASDSRFSYRFGM
jgi:hypothetical protein